MTPILRARDPGLQPERTALSWTRTAVAMSVNAALGLRAGVTHESTTLVMLSVVLVAIATLMLIYGRHRAHSLATQTPGPPSLVSVRICWTVSMSTALASIVGLMAIAK